MTQGLFDAFYLPPALARDAETTVQRFGPAHDAIELRLATVTPSNLARWIDALCAARAKHLAARPASEIHRVLERVAQRFLDPQSPVHRNATAWLARSGRFSTPMIARAIEDTFRPLAQGGVSRWVASELGSVAVLDHPEPDRSRIPRQAFGPEWMLQIYAGNVPGLPVWPFYSALAMKSAVLAKTASQEPVLAPLLARTIAEEDPDLGACFAVIWWKGGTDELDRAAIRRAPAVLAFGSDNATANIAREAHPDATLVLHGPKVSVGYISSASLTRSALGSLASRAAYDVALYDQQGCLSPHAFYVERGGEIGPAAFASALGAALEALRDELPRGEPSAERAASVQLYRAQAQFEEAIGNRGTQVLASREGTDWTLVYEDGAGFTPTPAYRTVRIHAVRGIEEVVLALQPVAHSIEAVGIEAKGREKADLAAEFAAIGVPRIAAVGSLQSPALSGTHGGVHRLAPFLRWSTVELGSMQPRSPKARRPKTRPASGSRSRKRKPTTKRRRGRR
ncbi:MAG TPA: acyl-CoA reductase [Candidatus Dormibacteraeota bacterium]|nr:acyl-CoA reductase [Candidatus Dormibacteraeota bacterium]